MSTGSGQFAPVDDATLSSGDSIMGDAVALARLGPGKPLGRTIVLSRLSVGNAGVLYAVYDPVDDERRAIRILRPRGGAKSATETLRREAKALASVVHPNLVRIHHVGTLHGVVYLMMDQLRGGTLRKWLDGEVRRWPEVLDVFRAIGSGLAAAHRAGIVHGDLRPRNVLFDARGVPHIVDFDIGRTPPSTDGKRRRAPGRLDDSSVESFRVPLTIAGERIGVPAYMSPEQYAGVPLDARSDQFSFCAMLYEALYGQLPFTGRSVEALFLAIADGRIQPPPLHARVPRWLREIVVRGLAHDPTRRWPSMDALLDALPDDADARRRRFVATAALALAVIAGTLAVRRPPPKPPSADAHVLAELTQALRRGDDTRSLALACELALRLELRRLDELETAGRHTELAEHLERARSLAACADPDVPLPP